MNREGFYTLTTDPATVHIAMNHCHDHTTGTGKMMVVNGVPVANQTVWSQVINVVPNTNYAFSTYVNAGVSSGGFATLQFSLNGTLLGEQFSTHYVPCEWQQFYAVWNSGNSTTATISIVNQNLQREGNDFALDDILFQSFTVLTDSAMVNVKPIAAAPAVSINGDLTPCEGTSVSVAGPAGALGYRWNDGATQQSRAISASGNYVLQTLGSNGCYSTPSDTVRIAVQPLPNAPVISLVSGSATTICPGDSSHLTATAASSYLWSNGAVSQSIFAKVAGSFSVQAVSAQGCRSVPSNEITVTTRSRPTQPRLSLSGDSVFCAGGSLTLTSSYATNNHWKTGETTQSITVTAAGTYWVYGQSATSCASLKRYVTVAVGGAGQRPIVSASGSTALCPGNTVTLTSNFPTGNTWSNGAVTQSITVSSAASYTVTNAGTCGTTTSLPTTVTVASLPPTPTITAPADLALCQGESVTLTSSATTGNLWSNGATTQSIVVMDPATYTVRQQSGACTTAVSQGVSITVAPKPAKPTVSANGPTLFCNGSDVTLTSSASANNVWSNGATTQSITVSATGNFYVKVQTPACFSDTSAHTAITVHQPGPVPSIRNTSGANITTASACEGSSVSLVSSYTSGTSVWSTNFVGPQVSISTVGTTVVTVKSVSTRGCQSAASTPVTVTISPTPAMPTIAASGPTQLCPGGSVRLTSSAATGNIWSNASTAGFIDVTAAGSYTVRTVTAGCSSAVSSPTVVSVVNLATPSVTSTGSTTFCEGGSVLLTSSAAAGNVWSNGDTARAITVTQPNSYSVHVQATGCNSAASTPIVVTVNPLPATPTVYATGPLAFCAGGSVTLSSSATSGNRWSTGGQGPVISVTASGSYTVFAISAQNCSSAVSAPIVVDVQATPDVPTITFVGTTRICAGNSITLNSSAGAGTAWSRGDTSTSLLVDQAGTYSAIAFTSAGCASAASAGVTITVEDLPQQPTINRVGGDSLQASVIASSYVWTLNGDTLPVTTQKIQIMQGGIYTVAASSANNCTGPASQDFVTAITLHVTALPLTLSPNPASQVLNISGIAGLEKVLVRDATGRILISLDARRADHAQVSVNELPAGAYSVQAVTKSGLATGRFVKE